MRLTCPNCSARYEVADSMIPPEGRDVQCSNCSTTWFQPGRRTDAQAAAAPRTPPPPPPVSEPAPPPAAFRSDAGADDDAGDDAAADPGEEAAGATPRRQTLDPALRSILAEEAAREARLRQAEAGLVETQGEMPLDEEPDDAHRARRRAELDAAPDAFDLAQPAAPVVAQAARDLFPDIEEINSTLRDTGDRSGNDRDASDIDTLDMLPRRRRGTRIGFLLALAIAAGGAAVYVNAARVATAVPALEPVLSGYVTAVNGARFWLDDLAQGLAGNTPEG